MGIDTESIREPDFPEHAHEVTEDEPRYERNSVPENFTDPVEGDD